MDLIIYVIATVLIAILGSSLIILYRKYVKSLSVIGQLILDKQVISERLGIVESMASKDFNDGFIKFISESRDAAFEYIESVQESIERYFVALDGGDSDTIATARIELFSHLPSKEQ
jgi:hypothetical protein